MIHTGESQKKYDENRQKVERGNAEKYKEKLATQQKLFVRDRLALLFDDGKYEEDGMFANNKAEGLPADGVVTAIGKVNGETVCVMANDSTVKAGSWGARTVEKIIRIQEVAEKLHVPLLYLVDSAGARITDQLDMFPNRRGAGRIFHNQVKLSGVIPQICLLFGPSAAGGAYIPAFCDIVVMVDGNASMYLGSPRMAEAVIGEKVTLEEMGGAHMHCSVSGCGDVLAYSEEEAISYAKSYLTYFPQNYQEKPKVQKAKEPKQTKDLVELIPENQNVPFDIYEAIDTLIDEGSFFEVKKLFAAELVTGLARIDGKVVGIIANQPKVKGGVLFVDSADKGAKFIQLCDAFHIPLLFLADVPGFMIGTKVERAGIIRHGAKLIAAMSSATVPKISVVMRKAYGAGLYAMAGPAFEPDCCLALPTAQIAVMGPEAAVNAVYSNKINEIEDPKERFMFVKQKQQEYKEHIDIYTLASELIIDDIVPANELRRTLIDRFRLYETKNVTFSRRKHPVYPV
ncbi:acyl-CoA carboxylase subunit beta [Priestia megaterium]|jgi:methylmalonyl-CoA decarboxylase subunit alpha|uniref:Carboxyl transferase domain protein n=1 Tax=Priestia megaterium (strain ATCC 14581 / DSM 32 / CCUG 1817 / JCM 2506 / NBRC 15308 / NCIMB 9376 / NCTC 10342 / NRRL B-14308 / VKM B-512 / Ford 19) TaxID=1348623 RepID=A0A0B6ADA4_PRIM2|nr:acyl-CoA carboxylase subunit beta [Priestia megaterium]AJI21506.1 carboxyl transferase domain protein [Priestia megaterium NBRC 15308 = ATCC 14581]KFN00317.1 carboxyl transferase domain protein [Priestia megaterium]KGJ73056.1 carboxylase [Priestia megaterium NBRC 15308 = ATCC 14581]MBU8752954.1 acyl-CoA carboxylase subunit beta [Priestia megaterium]MDH3185111.1 acyl-CoA carboxylase subunit beta [Priestia megaterium]